MKIMYVANRGDTDVDLLLEREMTELQQRSLTATGEAVTFHFFPDLPVEELPLQIGRCRPDILHIAAHGDKQTLSLSNASHQEIPIDAAMLRIFLRGECPPRIVYLNACNSHAMAKELTTVVPMAIGTTAPITNRAARAAAVLFYDKLIEGELVSDAAEASACMLEAIERRKATSKLYHNKNVDPRCERMHQVPRIVARFKSTSALERNSVYKCEFGMIGCRHDTVQTIFFTDDESYAQDEKNLEEKLTLVVRNAPVRGVIWSDYFWLADGDFRMYATATTAGGLVYSVATTLCQAIIAKYRFFDGLGEADLPRPLHAAIQRLRSEDGSGFKEL